MHIIYAVTDCSDKVYRYLFANVKHKPAYASHKYHRLLIEGLGVNSKVDVVANPPVNKGIIDRRWISLSKEQTGNVCYHHLPAIRNPLIRLAWGGLGTFFKTFALGDKKSVVVIDCLNRTVGMAGLMAARLRGRRCVGIVTDLPDVLQETGFLVKLTYFMIRHCTDYVFLTEAMNELLNEKGKPYVILEGHADIGMREHEVSLVKKKSPRTCMYAGGVSKQFAIDKLIKAFQKADIPNLSLELYGNCSFEDELLDIVAEDQRIFYGGVLLNSEIVEKEQQATLLINPRPTKEGLMKKYVTYSFPSKNMEYMASGTPLLTTVLPGMPKDYYPYVYLLEDETVDGIAKALKEIFAHTDEELFEKGKAAKEFILSTRNNVVQAGKILEMLEKTSDRK